MREMCLCWNEVDDRRLSDSRMQMRGEPSLSPVPDHRMTQCLFFPLIFFAGGGSSAATMAFQMC